MEAFEVFIFLLNLFAVGVLVYLWVRVVRRREILARMGWLKGILSLGFLSFVTLVFAIALIMSIKNFS